MDSKLLQQAEAIIESIDIPSQPQILINIYNEVQKPEPEFRKLKEHVSQDIAMSARIMKIANSAFFGLRYKVHSVEHALTVLGLENFTNIICTSSLREMLMSGSAVGDDLDTVFNHSMHVARIAQFVTHKARIFSGGIIFPSQTYMAGLFHDCGILVLAKKYSDYFQKIRMSEFKDMALVDIEESLYKTNHSVVGYVVAKSWQLPEVVCRVIQHHHHQDLTIHDDASLKIMSAINILSEGVISHLHDVDTEEEAIFGITAASMDYLNQLAEELNFDDDDLIDTVETAKDIIGHG